MRTLPIASALLVALVAVPASAAVVWTGDLETGDLSQFNFVLNETIDGNVYASAAQDFVLEGDWSAHLELHNDAIWPNGLRRVELQHLPDPARTAEGATTCLGWSFYLPEALPDDPGHTLGYWESQNSYQQMMAFNTNGQNIRFITQQPSYTEHWSADGVLTPGEWHRIAMCVLWSQDPGTGTVDVWFDGDQVVTAAGAKTLADGNPHFAQIGLLRGNVDFDGVPEIHIDLALEGDTIDDVDPAMEPPGSTGTGGGDDSGGATTVGPGGDDTTGDATDPTAATDPTDPTNGSGAATAGDDASGATATLDDSSGGTDSAGASDDDDGGCGCRHTAPAGAMWLWLPIAALLRRRRHDG